MYALKNVGDTNPERKYALYERSGAENPGPEYDLSFAVELKHFSPNYEAEPFLEYHYERTPDKELFLKRIDRHILLFSFLKEGRPEMCVEVRDWIERKRGTEGSKFSVLEWATVFYYANESKLLPGGKSIQSRWGQFMITHQVDTPSDTFKTKYYEARKRINNGDKFSEAENKNTVSRLKKVLPFIQENYHQAVTLVINDIEIIEAETSEY